MGPKSAFKKHPPTFMRAMPRESLVASRVSRFVGFEPSNTFPRVGFGFAYRSHKRIPFLFFFFFCFFPDLVWRAKGEGAFQGDGDEKCPGACVRDLEEGAQFRACTCTQPFAGRQAPTPTTGRFREPGHVVWVRGKHQKRKQIMLCTYFPKSPFDKLQFGRQQRAFSPYCSL